MSTTGAERDRAIDHRLRGFDVFAAEIAKGERGDSKRFRIVGGSLKGSMCKVEPEAACALPVLRPTINIKLRVDPGGPSKCSTI